MAKSTPPKMPRLGTALKAAANTSGVPSPASSSLFKSDIITMLYTSLKVMPDLDEVLRKAGMTRAALRKLVFDDEIAQAVDTRRDAAINTPWRLEGSTEPVVKFITDEIKTKEHLVFPGVWSARLYGYSVTQVVYERKVVDGAERIGLRWVGEMPFEYYFPQRDGTVLYRPQGSGEPEPIIPEKYLVPVVNPTYANPYGDAMLSRLYWLWFYRTHGWKFWVQWLETFGSPFLVGKTTNVAVDPAKNITAVQQLASQLDSVRRGSAIAIDKDSDVDMLPSTGVTGTGKQFEGFDQAVTRQIAKVILGQTLTSGEGQHGTQALGKVHEEVRQDKKRADLRILVMSGQQLVNNLHRVNGFAGDPPIFCMEDEKGIQADRATRDSDMVDKGLIIYTREYFEEVYGFDPTHFHAPGEPEFEAAKSLPAATQEIDPKTGKPIKKPAAAPKDKGKPKDKAKLAALLFKKQGATRFTPEQEVIEDGIDDLVDLLPDEIIGSEDIQQAIREASDANDLANRLSVLLQDADPQTFRAVLSHALFAAEVIGFVQAEERVTAPPVTAAAVPPAPAPAFELHVHAEQGPRVITHNKDDGTWRSDPAAPPKGDA